VKICFLCSEYPPLPHGGAGTFIQKTARALVRAGHEVRVVGVCRAGLNAPEHEQDEGVLVWRLREPAVRGGWLAGRIALYRLVRQWVRQGHIDVVESHDFEGPLAGWPRMAAPLVVRAQGSYSYFHRELGRPIPRKTFEFERLSYLRADAWIATSTYIGQRTRSLFRLKDGPHATLYNWADVPAAAPRFEHRHRSDVVFSGTLTAKKGIVSLIDAWSAIRERIPEATLHVLGKDGVSPVGTPMQQYLKNRLPPATAESVQFHGHVSHATVVERLATARLAVFPSYAEGFAFAPIEAMAVGCPTIYTKVGSGPELISAGRDGLLVDPSDPRDIAQAAILVLEDDELARRLGQNGRERVGGMFSRQVLLPANERFYRDLIRSFKVGHRQRPIAACG
jgi:glycosyltransferase involved in cell wall biosynthesis